MMQHSQIQEQIPLLALGGLPAEEIARLEKHLAVCPSCRALLDEYRFVSDELLAQVPPQPAPANIGIRLQNLASADAHKSGAQAPGSGDRPRFWNRPVVLPRWALAIGVLAVLLVMGAAGAVAFQSQRRDASAVQVVQLLNAREIKFVELTNATGDPGNSGYLCVTPGNPTAILWLHDLEPLDSNHVYQVWLRADTMRDNGGTFRANDDGRAVAVVLAPRPLEEYQEIGITVEPAAGSQAPTTPRVIGGKLD